MQLRSGARRVLPTGAARKANTPRKPRRSTSFLALLCALVLSSQALLPAPAGAQAKPRAQVSPPALTSERSPETRAEIPAGDFRNPPSAAGPSLTEPARPSFDAARSTPVDAETTPTRRIYANPDGSRTAVIDEKPVRFKDPAGAWQDFDLTLVPGPDGALVAKAAPSAARLGTRSDGALATVATEAGPSPSSTPAPPPWPPPPPATGPRFPTPWALAGTWCSASPPTAMRRR